MKVTSLRKHWQKTEVTGGREREMLMKSYKT